MKNLFATLGRLSGIHFSPDNHVVPILRWGRYHHVKEPGFFWVIPLIEQTLPPIKTGLQVGNFTFEEVLTKNNVPFKVHLTVLYNFSPNLAHDSAKPMLVRGGDELFRVIVKDYTNQGLRRLISQYDATELTGQEALPDIERNLTRLLTGAMRPLGIAPLADGGVLIKETVAPQGFKQAILDARRLEALLYVLASFPLPGLVEQAIRAGFMTGLERLESNVFLSNLPSVEMGQIHDWLNMAQSSARNGAPNSNGHARH